MNDEAVARLRWLIDDFISGSNRSLVRVHEIERVLNDDFAETELEAELTLELASYSPGSHDREGGLIGEAQLLAHLEYVLAKFLKN